MTVNIESESAFPIHSVEGELRDGDGSIGTRVTGGLTKRELFAAMAMHGYLASPLLMKSTANHGGPITELDIARQAISFADALLATLSDETKGERP